MFLILKITRTLLIKNRFIGYGLLIAVIGINVAIGQVKIGENPETIDPTSLLELESTSKTLVLPRVSNDEMNAITPLNGGLVYNTDEQCIFYYDTDTWNNLCTETGTSDPDGDEDDEDKSGISITEEGEIIYTYINEAGAETVITLGESGILHIGSPGSVFFAGNGTGAPTEDNELLFWDNENKRLGIGTNTPTNELEVNGILRSGRTNNSSGTAAFPSYHFTGSFDTGMYSPSRGSTSLASAGREVVRVTGGNRVGIMVTDPQATLHVGGDLRVDGTIIGSGGKTVAKKETANLSIRRLSEPKAFLTLNDHTLILEGKVEQVILPEADTSNIGHIFILKDLGGKSTELSLPYKDLNNKPVRTTKRKGTLWLQSDGTECQQIN
jgi:hypothetical protein